MKKELIKPFLFRMESRPEQTADDLYIFDDIGEYDDYDGEVKGFGPKKLLNALAEAQSDSLNVHINSAGGSLFDGIAVYNLLVASGKQITTIVDGIAASAASLIAMAGAKVAMYPTSQMMIHNCWTLACGNSKELRKVADQMDKAMAGACRAYLDKSNGKLSEEKLEELLEAESYLTAEDCVSLGLCDLVIDRKELEAEEKKETAVKADTETFMAAETTKAEAEPVEAESAKAEVELIESDDEIVIEDRPEEIDFWSF